MEPISKPNRYRQFSSIEVVTAGKVVHAVVLIALGEAEIERECASHGDARSLNIAELLYPEDPAEQVLQRVRILRYSSNVSNPDPPTYLLFCADFYLQQIEAVDFKL